MTHDEMDKRALEEFEREAAHRALQHGLELRTDRPDWANVAGLALQDLLVEHRALQKRAPATEKVEATGVFVTPNSHVLMVVDEPLYAQDGHMRVLSLPGGIRLPVRRDALLDVTAKDLIAFWSRQRPWRVRRGIQVLRVAVEWLRAQPR